MIHTLKCWPVYFKAILSGEKSFDIRRGEDRSYEANDYLDLQEWDPDRQAYTGAHCVKRVVYVMHGEPFAPPETWVLGLSRESRFQEPKMSGPIHISDFQAGYETDQIIATLIPIPGVKFKPYGWGAEQDVLKTIAVWPHSVGEDEPFRPSINVSDMMVLLQTHFKCFSLETFHGRHQCVIGTGPDGSFETTHREEAATLELAACMAAVSVWLDRHPELRDKIGRPIFG